MSACRGVEDANAPGADGDSLSNGIGVVDMTVSASSLLQIPISSNRELSVETPLARNSFSLTPR